MSPTTAKRSGLAIALVFSMGHAVAQHHHPAAVPAADAQQTAPPACNTSPTTHSTPVRGCTADVAPAVDADPQAQHQSDMHGHAAMLHDGTGPVATTAHDGTDVHGTMDHQAGAHGHAGVHQDHARPPAPDASHDGSVPAPAAMHHHHGAAAEEAMPGMQPRQPVPALTDADRAAAFPDLPGHATHDQGVFGFLQVNRLEAWDAAPGTGLAWEAQGWIGTDRHRVWLRSEGEREHGAARGDLEVFYGRPVAAWWDLLAGVRQSAGDGAPSTEAVVGVVGLAPQKLEVEATAFLAPGGRSGARVEVEYELLLTNRLVLQPLLEAELHGRDDAARRTGAGLGRVEAGLRLRYEFSRRIAPYLGVVHERRYGATARYLVEDGEPVRDTRVVAGVRLQF